MTTRATPRRKMRFFGLVAVVVGWSVASSPAAAEPEMSRNLRLIAHFPSQGGTDIAFDAGSAYVGNWGDPLTGTVGILDLSEKRPRLVGEIECGRGQSDVAALGSNVVAVANHDGICGRQPSSGVNLFDVSDPSNPQQLGFWPIELGSHTLTKHPSEQLIYSSNSGNLVDTRTHIIDVSDPASPRQVALVRTSCHDLTFRITKREKLAFCAVGGNGVTGIGDAIEIWDVEDPVDPQVITRFGEDELSYPHLAVASPDGGYLVVSDEAQPASCSQSPEERTYGALSIYDIRDRTAPELVSYINVPRGDDTCWGHNFNFIPGTRLLVTSWYDGGMSVYDLADPVRPTEVAFFRPDDQIMWSAYWHRGRIYTNGYSGAFVLGLDI